MRTGLFWLRIFSFAVFLWIVIFAVTVHNRKNQQDITIDSLNQTLNEALLVLNKIHIENGQLKQQVSTLSEKINVNNKQQNTEKNKLEGPSEEYELLRRRIFSNVKEFWYYVSSEWKTLSKDLNATRFEKTRNMIDEHYRSLITDVAKLADVDGHSQWRQLEHNYLCALIQKRLKHVQNPPDCSKAQKVVCQFKIESVHLCGLGSRLHYLINCIITAYGLGRTMILDEKDQSWYFTTGGWNTLFMPLSDTCESTEGQTTTRFIKENQVNITTQVITFLQPSYNRIPFDPLRIPEDLAKRIRVLHGDPPVWWIGQLFKYMLRPQNSTSDKIAAYAKRVKFRTPCVGVHIRRTDKLKAEAGFHELDEYMYNVEEYYKLKELSIGGPVEKRIYLATDEPKLFEEAKLKYPDYEIIGDPDLSKTGIPIVREEDDSLVNAFIEIYLLARCDYLVCTFSSNMCRLAYEIMNSLSVDASTMFRSLDDTFYYSHQVHRLAVAILPHKADGPEEMDLQVGDQIEVAGNHWDGYSKGLNLRTRQFQLYPTFKVIPQFEVAQYPTYPHISVDDD